jgi:cytochrome c oxidase assembly protein subunit 15
MSATSSRSNRQIGIWLLGIAGLIFVMVLVGGITRLTDSGLSITEWDPIMGAVPPMSQEGWDEAFEKYQQIPEYKLVNKGMSLGEFKFIFFWEWFHRLLGRFIGLAFAIPFVYFLATRKVERALLPKLIGLFVLGGAQGALGWYMVMSGLVDRVDVSQYRLTAHLGVAVVLYLACLWVAYDLLHQPDGTRIRVPNKIYQGAIVLTILVFVQLLLGGFVAGLDAGIGYNTWPLMEGAFIPPHLFDMSPWYSSAFEDPMTVQFDHRMLAYVITGFAGLLWFWARREGVPPRFMGLANVVLVTILLQVLLGILTLVFVIPLSLALLHQGGALVVLASTLYWVFIMNRYQQSSIA